VSKRIAAARPKAPLAAVVLGYDPSGILDVPLMGFRTTKDKVGWVPREYRNFADEELALADPAAARIVGRLALVPHAQRPSAREIADSVTLSLTKSIPKTMRVDPHFIAYGTDFAGRDLKQNLEKRGWRPPPRKRTRNRV
jgi:hypothetical protein